MLHIALVPALVFGLGPVPALGITGAGLATVISFAASTATLAWYLASGRTSVTLSLRGIRFERRLFGEILRVGAPMSLAPVLNNVALATLTTYAGLLGATSLAAFGAAVRLEYLLYPLNFGLGAAVLAMVGSNIGARQFERAARIAWIAVGLSAGVMASVSVLAIAAPDLWMGLFSHDPAILAAAALYLAIVGLAYPFVAANTLMSAFQSTRQPEWPLTAMTCRLLVVVVGGWIALEVLHTDLVGLAVVTALGLADLGRRAGRRLPPLRQPEVDAMTSHAHRLRRACPHTRETAASIMPPSMPRAAMSMWRTPPTTPSMCSIRAANICSRFPTCPASPAPW